MRAQYEIVHQLPHLVVIRDVGHAAGKTTVTNDAEAVVCDLRERGVLKDGAQLLYYDSEGHLDGLDWEGREERVGFYYMGGPYFVAPSGRIHSYRVHKDGITLQDTGALVLDADTYNRRMYAVFAPALERSKDPA